MVHHCDCERCARVYEVSKSASATEIETREDARCGCLWRGHCFPLCVRESSLREWTAVELYRRVEECAQTEVKEDEEEVTWRREEGRAKPAS